MGGNSPAPSSCIAFSFPQESSYEARFGIFLFVGDDVRSRLGSTPYVVRYKARRTSHLVHAHNQRRGIIPPVILYRGGGQAGRGVVFGGPEHLRQLTVEKALGQAKKIYDTTLEILRKAKNEDITTISAAKMIAEERILAARQVSR